MSLPVSLALQVYRDLALSNLVSTRSDRVLYPAVQKFISDDRNREILFSVSRRQCFEVATLGRVQNDVNLHASDRTPFYREKACLRDGVISRSSLKSSPWLHSLAFRTYKSRATVATPNLCRSSLKLASVPSSSLKTVFTADPSWISRSEIKLFSPFDKPRVPKRNTSSFMPWILRLHSPANPLHLRLVRSDVRVALAPEAQMLTQFGLVCAHLDQHTDKHLGARHQPRLAKAGARVRQQPRAAVAVRAAGVRHVCGNQVHEGRI